jgi:hypothetical protein
VKPRLDTRTDRVTVVSRSRAQHHAVSVDDSSEIEGVAADADIVAIEAVTFPYAARYMREAGMDALLDRNDLAFVSRQCGTWHRIEH